MAQEMNKKFDYRAYHFNICVQLNTKVERTPNGRRYHTVVCNDMGVTNYYHKREVLDESLVLQISIEEELAKKFVDELEDGKPPYDQRLADLGFV
jgi:hypothetical protein